MTPEPSRPDEKPKINENTPMAYPMSVLLAELQRVKHKINELEADRVSQLTKIRAKGEIVPSDGGGVMRAFRERLSCIGALEAKVARLNEAIHALQSMYGLEGKTSREPYDCLLHLDVLLKHFPSLAKAATDIRVLRDLELQAFELEGQ